MGLLPRRVGLFAVAGLFAVSACELPLRDNPSDPVRKPVARLTVNTLEGSRATAFDLDASESHDPLERGTLEVVWELDDVRYDVFPDEEEYEDFDDDSGDRIGARFPDPFPAAFVDSNGEGTIVRRVRVKVIARDGAYDIAEGVVVVRNRRPIVSLGEDLFISPLRVEPVVLDAFGGGFDPTTIDEDGDELRFTWTQVSGELVPLVDVDATRRRVSFTPPVDGRSILFRVVGSDGMGSDTDHLQVHFESQIWAGAASPSRVYRIFPGFSSVSDELETVLAGPTPFVVMSAFAVTPGGFLWTFENAGGGNGVVRRLDPFLRQVSETSIAGYSRALHMEASGEDLCLAMRVTSSSLNTNGAFVRIDETGGIEASVTQGGTVRAHALDADECWATTFSGVHRFSDSGALTPVVTGLSSLTRSERDVAGNLWFLESQKDTFSTGPATRIRRVSTAGAVSLVYDAFDGVATVTDLAARSDGAMWLHDSLRKLYILSLDGTLAETDAPLTRLSTSLGGRRLASDLAEEGLWISDSQSGDLIHLLDAGGTVLEVARLNAEVVGGSIFNALAVAPGGGVFTSISSVSPTLLRIPGHGRVTQRVDVDLQTFVPYELAADSSRGTLWMSDRSPLETRLVRFGDGGRFLANVPTHSYDVRSRDDGSVVTIRIDPDTAAASVVTVSGTGAILTTAPLGAELPVAFPLDLDLDPGDLDGAICAVIIDEGIPGLARGWRVDPLSGNAEELFNVPNTEPFDIGQIGCVQDRGDGATWMYTRDSSLGTAVLQRFAAGETSASFTLTSAAGMAGPFTYDSTVIPDPVEGVWIGDNAEQRMYRFLPSGALEEGPPNLYPTLDEALIARCPEEGADPGCRELWDFYANDLGRYQWNPGDPAPVVRNVWERPFGTSIQSFAFQP